jgi:hypothetical protein
MFIFPQGEIQSVALPPQADSPVTILGVTSPGAEDLEPWGTDACWLGMDIDEIDPPLEACARRVSMAEKKSVQVGSVLIVVD